MCGVVSVVVLVIVIIVRWSDVGERVEEVLLGLTGGGSGGFGFILDVFACLCVAGVKDKLFIGEEANHGGEMSWVDVIDFGGEFLCGLFDEDFKGDFHLL